MTSRIAKRLLHYTTILALVGAAQVSLVQADEDQMFDRKFQLAEVFEIASFAADHCPGLHVSHGALIAAQNDEGITEDDLDTAVWRFWKSRGQTKARNGFGRDARGWCERVIRWLGPDHLADARRALLLRE